MEKYNGSRDSPYWGIDFKAEDTNPNEEHCG